jgi:deferrochelatase/peroxidase EfeB
MANSNRLRQLGDVEENELKRWDTVWQEKQVDLVLIIQATSAEMLEKFSGEEWCQFAQWGLQFEAEETGYQDLETSYQANIPDALSKSDQGNGCKPGKFYVGKEHFGFHDGISQPDIEGSPKPSTGKEQIKAGEFILGYRNEDGNLPLTPTISAKYDVHNRLQPVTPGSQLKSKCPVRGILYGLTRMFALSSQECELKDFGRNGSYLVLRKMSQDVAGFRSYFKQFENSELLKAKMVGRWPSGAPLTLSPTKDNDALAEANDFKYADLDEHGYGCPLGAHIRRANPRTFLDQNAKGTSQPNNRHRIIRRGALYGPPLPDAALEDDGNDRGLLFLCINANIRQQFEFIQQSWLNNPKFSDLDSETDPLIPHKGTSMTIPKYPIREKLNNLPSFVTVKGGEYFFLPSISALHFLASYQP